MPQYFFDIVHEGRTVRRDHQGRNLAVFESAEIEATEIWKDLRKERSSGGADPEEWTVLILDEVGSTLAEMPSTLAFWRADTGVREQV